MAQNKKLTGVIAGRAVKSIVQEGPELRITFADGSTMVVKMAEETSCVMVRDAKGTIEYVD